MEISIVILGVLLLAQLIERHLYARQMNEKLSEAMKAVMSRNINEFLTATTETKSKFTPLPESDEVNLSEATDEEFNKHIKQVVKS